MATQSYYRVANDVIGADCREVAYGSRPNVYATREAADVAVAALNASGDWDGYAEANGRRPSYWVEEVSLGEIRDSDVIETA